VSSIYKTNLNGRKIYRKESGAKKYFFGTVIADYDFETAFIKTIFGNSTPGNILIMTNDPNAGWPARLSPNCMSLLSEKKIPFNELSGLWYLPKALIENGDYALKERMVIDNE
jgi:hypothetical protein